MREGPYHGRDIFLASWGHDKHDITLGSGAPTLGMVSRAQVVGKIDGGTFAQLRAELSLHSRQARGYIMRSQHQWSLEG